MKSNRLNEITKNSIASCFVAGMALFSTSAYATLFTSTLTASNFSGLYGNNAFTLDFLTPTQASGPATLTLTLLGDFKENNQNIAVSAEGLNLGTLLDGNPGNDPFDHTTDKGCSYTNASCAPLTTITSISLANLAPMIANGHLLIMLDPSSKVIDKPTATRQEYVTATLTFEQVALPAVPLGPNALVPEPSSVTLASLCMTGWGWSQRRKKSILNRCPI